MVLNINFQEWGLSQNMVNKKLWIYIKVRSSRKHYLWKISKICQHYFQQEFFCSRAFGILVASRNQMKNIFWKISVLVKLESLDLNTHSLVIRKKLEGFLSLRSLPSNLDFPEKCLEIELTLLILRATFRCPEIKNLSLKHRVKPGEKYVLDLYYRTGEQLKLTF